MRYYSFSPASGEFIASRAPQIDPLESERAGAIVYCLPGAHETPVEPPSTVPGTVAAWTGEAWEVRPIPEEPAPEPPSPTAKNIKAECADRIYAVANSNAQMNMASFAAASLFSAEQMAAYTAGLQWVVAMRAKCATLIATADPSFADDASWPACPPEAAALAAQF